jgi:hypothetical protein
MREETSNTRKKGRLANIIKVFKLMTVERERESSGI